MHDQFLGGVADAGTVGLGVEDNLGGHVEVGRRIDVDVAVARAVDHVGHRCVLFDGGNEPGTAPGNEQIDVAFRLHQGRRCLAARVLQ